MKRTRNVIAIVSALTLIFTGCSAVHPETELPEITAVRAAGTEVSATEEIPDTEISSETTVTSEATALMTDLSAIQTEVGTTVTEAETLPDMLLISETPAVGTTVTVTEADAEQEMTLLASEMKAASVNAEITLSDSGIKIKGAGAKANGSVLTINKGGSYSISGDLTGQICVNVGKEEEAELILNGVNVKGTKSLGSPLYVKSADKVTINLKKGSTNTFTDTGTYKDTGTDAPTACIYSEDDLTVKGEGTLIVNGNYKNGIQSKNDIRIKNGIITVTSVNDGIKGKDSVVIEGEDAGTCKIKVTSGGDGIVSTEKDKDGKGIISISNASISIVSGGGSANEPAHNEDFGGFGSFGGFNGGSPEFGGADDNRPDFGGAMPEFNGTMPEFNGTMPSFDGKKPEFNGKMPDMNKTDSENNNKNVLSDNEQKEDTKDTDTVSAKALRAARDITIESGTVTIDSSDDAIHSDGTVTVNDGTLSIKCGDDGIHADSVLTLNGGTGKIRKSYEGLEAAKININGGKWSVTASDDGINASDGTGGGFKQADPDTLLTITGGTVTVDSTGDGLDSNGSISVSGGTVTVYGTDNGGNAPLDYDGAFDVTGGTVIAGGSSGMAQTFSSVKNGAVAIYFTSAQGSGAVITLTSSAGKKVCSYTAKRNVQFLTFTSDRLKDGETYTISVNGTKTGTVKLSGITSVDETGKAVSGGSGGFGGGAGRNKGRR